MLVPAPAQGPGAVVRRPQGVGGRSLRAALVRREVEELAAPSLRGNHLRDFVVAFVLPRALPEPPRPTGRSACSSARNLSACDVIVDGPMRLIPSYAAQMDNCISTACRRRYLPFLRLCRGAAFQRDLMSRCPASRPPGDAWLVISSSSFSMQASDWGCNLHAYSSFCTNPLIFDKMIVLFGCDHASQGPRMGQTGRFTYFRLSGNPGDRRSWNGSCLMALPL